MWTEVYQDQDPIGKGRWFSYVSCDRGHVLENFGGYDTPEQARAVGDAWIAQYKGSVTNA